MADSQLVDWIMGVSESDLSDIDREIEEEKAYLDKLTKARRVIASLLCMKIKDSATKGVSEEKFNKASHAIAKALKKQPHKTSQLLKIAGCNGVELSHVLKSDWFKKRPDGYWELSPIGLENFV